MTKISLPRSVDAGDVASWACDEGMAFFRARWGDADVPVSRATVRGLIAEGGAAARQLYWFVARMARADDRAVDAFDSYFRRVDSTYCALRDAATADGGVLWLPDVAPRAWELAYHLNRDRLAELIFAHFDLPD